jgi:hypothetical protein
VGRHRDDPNPQALFGQAFLELQFYPDAIVNNCSSAGGFNVSYAPDKFTVCSPVWQVSSKSNAESAAFSTPAGRFCVPGQTGCDSYDTAH